MAAFLLIAGGAIVGLLEQAVFNAIARPFTSVLVEAVDQSLSNPEVSTQTGVAPLLQTLRLVVTGFVPWWVAGIVTVLAANEWIRSRRF